MASAGKNVDALVSRHRLKNIAMRTSDHRTPVGTLCYHNASLLDQSLNMIRRLQSEAKADFEYSQAVGPHTRHVIEHYQALLRALAGSTSSVDYDARHRDVGIQTDPAQTIIALQRLMEQLAALANNKSLALETPLSTRLKAGAQGELELEVQTTLGRELLFLASHTVHHFALLSHYCRAAGVELGHDFGKAPATIAFEIASTATGV